MSSLSEQNAQACKAFRKELEALGASLSQSVENVVNEMAQTGIKKAKDETPTGDYSGPVIFYTQSGKLVYFTPKSHKLGGTMKNRWKKTLAHRDGNQISGGYYNNLFYAIYVNNGHRIVNRWGEILGYVKGQRILEKSIAEVELQTQALFDAEISRVKAKTGF